MLNLNIIERLCNYKKDKIEEYLIFRKTETVIKKAKEYIKREWDQVEPKIQLFCKFFCN